MSNNWIIVAVILIPLVFVIMLYNRLIALRQSRKNAFSDIDVQLKQRFDLIPQLVETVKGYAGHEKTVFENITEARSRVGRAGAGTVGGGSAGAERLQAEGMLGSALMGLFAVAENYPALKADQNFLQLQAELSDIENKIAAARRFFNAATNEYNTAVQQFPANLIASMFGFKEEPFFDVGAEEAALIQKAPAVKF
ncbi:MAG TPA: LemA family protein [Micavibrio sp.]